jgi:hypothetical protein
MTRKAWKKCWEEMAGERVEEEASVKEMAIYDHMLLWAQEC